MVPFELVEAVVAETGRTERRLRALLSRVGCTSSSCWGCSRMSASVWCGRN
ncbi:hypothetical protein [Streptomyces lydicamycinicus]|uniref:hypothetical protein n=1 Tax=Streptomyces lydicamycinicus TaxID=1546107 RepID=UPI003C2D91C6